MDIIQFWGIFVTGLLAGGLSCMAVQGGLLAATIAQRTPISDSSHKIAFFPVSIFLLAKLIAYTILGFLLGWFGSLFQLSLQMQLAIQVIVGIFLLGNAMHLLTNYPVFRYFVIQPPRIFTRLIRKETKNSAVFAPALLGASTVLIPCGATQAVMAISIASGSPLIGALILFAFTLGTLPIFLLLGIAVSALGTSFHHSFNKLAGIALLGF